MTAITATVVGVILTLAVWFGMHVVFAEVRTITSLGLQLDVPVFSKINVAAAALVLAALVAVFRLKFGPVTVPAGCALARIMLAAPGGVL